MLSITWQPLAVAVQPDPSSFAMYPALSSSSAMGWTVAARLRLGRVASDRKRDNISYVIGSIISKMPQDGSRFWAARGTHPCKQCDDRGAGKQFRAEQHCRQIREMSDGVARSTARVARPEFLRARARDQSLGPVQRCRRQTLDAHGARVRVAPEPLAGSPLGKA